MSFSGQGTWRAGSAKVEGNLESEDPTWVLTALKGRRWIDLASGPLSTRALAEAAARALNDTDPDGWDRFIEHELRLRIDGGGWG